MSKKKGTGEECGDEVEGEERSSLSVRPPVRRKAKTLFSVGLFCFRRQ